MDISNPAFISGQRTAGYALQSNTETQKKSHTWQAAPSTSHIEK